MLSMTLSHSPKKTEISWAWWSCRPTLQPPVAVCCVWLASSSTAPWKWEWPGCSCQYRFLTMDLSRSLCVSAQCSSGVGMARSARNTSCLQSLLFSESYSSVSLCTQAELLGDTKKQNPSADSLPDGQTAGAQPATQSWVRGPGASAILCCSCQLHEQRAGIWTCACHVGCWLYLL